MLSTCNRTEFLFEKTKHKISKIDLEKVFKEICFDRKITFQTDGIVNFETNNEEICKYFFQNSMWH